jgi:segregation and condensation protein A
MTENTASAMNLPYLVKLGVFEGPLDLLLYLIKKNEVSIYDIPIIKIAEQYIEYVELMQTLNIDVAGEFLAMTATLLYIKSRMLLPSSETEDDEQIEPSLEDLRRRLLDYQRFKEAAVMLQSRNLLGRDVFVRSPGAEDGSETSMEIEIEEVSLFDLIDALKGVLARLPDKSVLEISDEEISLKDRIQELIDLINEKGRLAFDELFADARSRLGVIVSFLALLELAKRRLVRLHQTGLLGSITIVPAVEKS